MRMNRFFGGFRQVGGAALFRSGRAGCAAALVLATAACSGERADEPSAYEIGEQDLILLSPDDGALWDVRDVLEVDGVFWVLKASPPFVHGFDESGDQVAVFGSVGEGPGEMRFPRALWPGNPAGTVTVWDAGSRTALTFSVDGTMMSSQPAPGLPGMRADIETVTFGDPFRRFREAGTTVVARFDAGVNHGSDLWGGTLVRVHDGDPGDQDALGEELLVDFARDLRGGAERPSPESPGLVPVPLWDGCPDGRVAVLDPIAPALHLFRAGESDAEAIPLPWTPAALRTVDKYAWLRSQIEAEARGEGMDAAAIDQVAEAAFEYAEELFPDDAPAGVDLLCAPDRVWIQQFHGDSHPLGYGPHWRTVSLDGPAPRFGRVALPPGFQPVRFAGSGMLGVVTDSLSLQRLARVELPPELR